MKRLIDLYVYRSNGDRIEFLLLKRAAAKIYGGQWRMVGGKVRPDEASWEAALREMREETSLEPVKFWSVPSINHFYEASSDQVHLIPVFAAEVDPASEPLLDSEHTTSIWLGADQACERIHWPEQQRLIRLIDQILTHDQWLDSWHISLP